MCAVKHWRRVSRGLQCFKQVSFSWPLPFLWCGNGERSAPFAGWGKSDIKPMSVEKTDSSCGPDEDSEESLSGPGTGHGAEPLHSCDRQNWMVSPRCSPEEACTISPVLAEETFRYMTFLELDPSPSSSSSSHPNSYMLSQVLSADRVEQMTKTYSDMDMVTHLLTERDRDLELAARIGQSLLQRNQLLQGRNQAVEEQLTQALDQVQQLQHVLCKKDELLRMVASVSEESETDSSSSTPLQHSKPLPVTLTFSQLEALQSKLRQLEEENVAMRSEACHLETETISYEEKEHQLVNDCVKELCESNSQIMALTDELSKKNDDLLRHQEDMTQLLSQMVDLQHRVKELALEKEELRIHLLHSKDAQWQLTAELNEVHSRNVECTGMLQESQEEVKELRSRRTPSAGLRRHHSFGLIPMDSLAGEIEVSLRRQLSAEGEFAFQDQTGSPKRVFQTVRSINESARHPTPRPIPGSTHSSVVMTAQPFQSCVPGAHLRREEEATPTNTNYETTLGQPGTPGGSDLTSALHRLSLRRQNFLCERQFFQEERDRKLQALARARPDADGEGSGCMTNLSDLSSASVTFKSFLPEKLQIVKPMEGSFTLHQWQQLAQPHLATILDPHPGVVTKGFRPLSQDTVYSLTDLEEDEEEAQKGKSGQEKQEEEEEEEEMGITFQVQCVSTPEEERERKIEGTPLRPSMAVPPLSQPSQAPPTSPSPSPGSAPPPAPQQSNSHNPSTPAPSPAHNPGKCLSSTFSTFTFTTCRILHPSDITQVTPSSVCLSSGSDYTPSSLRSVPSTPVTPYRLSLGSSSPLRCPAPPQGLAQLLLERGISAQRIATERTPQNPAPRLLPSTPPNSPSHSPPPSPAPLETRPAPPPPADNFLASRPAELFLQEVYGLRLGRLRPDPSGPAPPLSRDRASVRLVERLRRLGLAGVLQGAESEAPRPQDPPTILATGSGSLLNGLRRNHSLPCMVRGRSQSAGSSSHLAPPPHSSLALPITPWGSLKEPAVSLSSSSSSTVQVPPSPHKA
ncbi:hypothetical protein SKAU_G00254120 [Synaphobranchus kaupii]|uniref:Trafficking protein, kinesin binding 2 n=1 Tax=Synaphobranchus kaupii TaxID=118154 RepID=A0A9Q1F3U3_SYNKA|nr:hypothetical protein SKAU_G00254120 [Synaphobranchus kaupii]